LKRKEKKATRKAENGGHDQKRGVGERERWEPYEWRSRNKEQDLQTNNGNMGNMVKMDLSSQYINRA